MKILVSFGRFAFVGFGATAIHVGVAAGLIEGMRVSPGFANGVAFLVANLASYLANTLWSFKSRLGYETWTKFAVVSIAAWTLTIVIASAIDRAGGHYFLGVAVVVTVIPMFNFVAHRMFTFRSPPEADLSK